MDTKLTISGFGSFLLGWFGSIVMEIFPMTGWEISQETARIIVFICTAFMA